MSARSTVSPPSPESKTPIGARQPASWLAGGRGAGRSPDRGADPDFRRRRDREHDVEAAGRRRRAAARVQHARVLVGVGRRGRRATASRRQVVRQLRARARRRADPRRRARCARRRPGRSGRRPRHRGVRRVVRRERARRARSRRRRGRGTVRPSTSASCLERDAAEPQDAVRPPVQSTIVDSTPTRARPAVEDEVDVVAEVGAHVGGGGRAHPPEAVGRRRGDPAAERVAAARARAAGRAPAAPPCRARR